MTMKTEDVIRLCQERAAAYGALRASSPTAIALDAAAERLAELNAQSARVRQPAKTPLIVWSPDGETPPMVAHTTHGSAHRAAHLLATKHPGRTFYVMERVGDQYLRLNSARLTVPRIDPTNLNCKGAPQIRNLI